MLSIIEINISSLISNVILRELAERSKGGRSRRYIAKIYECEVGFLCYDDWSDKSNGFIYKIFVLSDYRGQGIGRNLLSYSEALAKSLHCTLIRIEPHTFDRTVNINWLISWYQNKDINQCQAIRKKWKNFWHTALSIQFFQAIDSMGRPERPPGRLRHWWVNYFVSNSVESSPTNNTCEFPSLLRQATPHTEN